MKTINRRAMLLALAVAAGCTSQEAATPTVPPNTVATTTTTTTTVAPATTIAATTTVESTTTTSTVESTTTTSTTTPQPSGNPTSSVTVVYAGGAEDGWLELGRWTGAAWREPDADDDLVPDSVMVHELDEVAEPGTTGAPAAVCGDERTGPTISPDPGGLDEPDFGYRSIAFPADWNTIPRTVSIIDADIDAYTEAGRDAFADVDTDAGTVKQIVISDLDGDGDTESLVAFGGPSYSTLLLIDADSGEATTVAQSVADEDGSFSRFRTLLVADANGDELMEFVVHSWTPTVATVTLYSYDGSDASEELTGTCGSPSVDVATTTG